MFCYMGDGEADARDRWGPNFGVRANTVAFGHIATRLTAAKEAGAFVQLPDVSALNSLFCSMLVLCTDDGRARKWRWESRRSKRRRRAARSTLTFR